VPKPQSTVTKAKPTAKKIDWEKLRGCLQKWKEETCEKVASLRHVAVELKRECVNDQSPVSELMDHNDLDELIDSFEETLCRLDNTTIYPLVTDIVHNPLDCLKK
jgi:hypothetical protein